MSKSIMPWNKTKAPPTVDANTLEHTFEDMVLKLLERPIRDAVRQAFVKSLGSVARGPSSLDIRPPKDGTKCAAIWSELDRMRNTGNIPKLENILHAAVVNDWNPATTRTQYATWRRYHGIPAQERTGT